MKEVVQISSKRGFFYGISITDPGDGTLNVPRGSIWIQKREFILPEYHPQVGTSVFRLRVEMFNGKPDYLLDLTQEEGGNPLAIGIGTPLVAWRDSDSGEISVLRHSFDAA